MELQFLKVDSNEKIREVGKKTVIDLQSGIVAIEVYLKFELVFSCKTPYFRFRLLQPAHLIGDVTMH
jgi:hypothetical protein